MSNEALCTRAQHAAPLQLRMKKAPQVRSVDAGEEPGAGQRDQVAPTEDYIDAVSTRGETEQRVQPDADGLVQKQQAGSGDGGPAKYGGASE